MNRDREFLWDTIICYCFTFGGLAGAAVLFFMLTGFFTGNKILENTGICLSIPSAMGFVGALICQIIYVVKSRTAKKKEKNSTPEIENSSEKVEEDHVENSSMIQPIYESDDACEESGAGDTAGENDKEMPPEYIRSADSNVSGYEGMDPDSEGDSETATKGNADSEVDMAKKEYMVEISEQSAKNIKVVAKDSCEAVELAKEIYRNESPFLSDKSVQTTVNFWAKPDDSRYESFFCEKEGGNIII